MSEDEEIVLKCLDFDENSKIVSLPIQFAYLPVDILAKQFTKLNSPHEHRIHYLGPRYPNTQTMHKKCAYSELSPFCHGVPDRSINKYKLDVKRIANSFFINERLRTNHFYKAGVYYRAFEGMNPTLDFSQEFIFNGSFESANLDCVIKYKQNEYDLFLRIDSNTRGHLQWFYFSISNGMKKQKIRLNICNISKPGTFYEHQMQPYTFSRKQFELNNLGWAQGSTNISNVSFAQKPLNYKVLQEKITTSPYCYSFDYQFALQNDQVYFAYCIPYTFSQLMEDISNLPPNIVHIHNFGHSLSGIGIPILHITDHSIEKKDKFNVLITGRVHPGESNGSHVLKGFLSYLCSNEKSAVQVRKLTNFLVVPMLNPDGVILGNNRCSASGRDLNRIFPNCDKQLFPEIFKLKQFVSKFLNFREILIYYDFHGHSKKKNTFFYGPAYPLSNPNYLKCRVLPRIIQKINCAFRYYSCLFSISESKKSTGRAAMFELFEIPFTYTVQSSIGYYYDCEQLKIFSFSREAYEKMGSSICEGTSTFIQAIQQYNALLKQRRAQRERKRNKSKKADNRAFFHEDEAEQGKAPILKIFYRDSEECLMMKLLQEIKFLPDSNQRSQKLDADEQLDKEASSDQHDEREDFEATKLKQFNNLIIQNARKQVSAAQTAKINLEYNSESNANLNENNKIRISKVTKDGGNKTNYRSWKNYAQQEQMELLEELNMKIKSKSSHGARVKSIIDERTLTKMDIKRNKTFTRRFENQIREKFKFDQPLTAPYILQQPIIFSDGKGGKTFQFQDRKTTYRSYKKNNEFEYAETEINIAEKVQQKVKNDSKKHIYLQSNHRVIQVCSQKEKQKEKIHRFSQIHFPQDHSEQKVLKHQKTDLLRRNIERRKKQEEKSKSNCGQTVLIRHQKRQISNFDEYKKKVNQIRIDDLMQNLENRSKMLRESVKYKDSSQFKIKANCMFPSSFYCMRQQINNTKKKTTQNRQSSHSWKEPLQISVKQIYK